MDACMLRASSKARLVKLGEARLASIDHHLVWRLNAFFVILGRTAVLASTFAFWPMTSEKKVGAAWGARGTGRRVRAA